VAEAASFGLMARKLPDSATMAASICLRKALTVISYQAEPVTFHDPALPAGFVIEPK
jgi:hypothetical protein